MGFQDVISLSKWKHTVGNWVTGVSQSRKRRTMRPPQGFVSYFIPRERKRLVESSERRKYMVAVWEVDSKGLEWK